MGEIARSLLTPLFRAWWRMSRGVTLGVRGVARDGEGRVALVRHTYRTGWYLPGGGVEHGQTAQDALAEEMAQEAGVEITAPARLLGLYSNHAIFANDHVAVFLVSEWRACARTAAGEIAEMGFFPLDALPQGTTPGTRRRLAEAFEGAAIAAHW